MGLMRIKCTNCNKGIVEDIKTCPDCNGVGYLNVTLGVGSEKKDSDKCPTCNGSGKLIERHTCEACNGEGFFYVCDFCGVNLDDHEMNVCSTCEENPIAIELEMPLDEKYLNGKRALVGKVINSHPRKGVLVDLNLGFVGHFKSQEKYNKDDVIAVRLKRPISRNERGENKTVPVIPIKSKKFKIVKKYLEFREMSIPELKEQEGAIGKVLGVITNIFQVPNGPIIYDISDEMGNIIKGYIFVDGADKPFPGIYKDTVVYALLKNKKTNDQERYQLYQMEKANARDSLAFLNRLAGVNRNDSTNLNDVDFFVESGYYSELKPEFVKAAQRIRYALLTKQNIIMRYHSPCVDGTTGAYAIDYAIRKYLMSKGARKEDYKRSIRRIPQRNPHFEVREVARDMSFSLDDGVYPSTPLYILVDVGSTSESRDALGFCEAYGVDVIIVDHHMLDKTVSEKAFAVINSSDKDEEITSGMLAVELAKFIAQEHNLDNYLPHLAAISAISDKSKSVEASKYIELAEGYEFNADTLDNIHYALDYLVYGLRHFDGGEVTRNLLGLTGNIETRNKLIESLTPTAKSLFSSSLRVLKKHIVSEELSNGVTLQIADFELYTPRYEYPENSDLLLEIHSELSEEKPNVVTIGLSSDFMIIRSNQKEFDFSTLLDDLITENPDHFIKGAGHKHTGSIQFYAGYRDEVLDIVKKAIGK